MCYAIPGKVVEISGGKATIDYFGEIKYAHNELVDVAVGDYIYAQGGFIIQKLKEKDALETLETWKELFFELREKDLRLSALAKQGKISQQISLILDKAAEGRELKKDELLTLLKITDPNELEYLYKTANFLRQKHLGNSCCVHGIIEFSNYCSSDCEYCGIRASNKINRYRMTDEEVLSAVEDANIKHGFKALVLQSGEDPEFPVERLERLIKEIKQRFAVLLFISTGEIGEEGQKRLYAAGARGLLMRFETSNPEIYSRLHCGEDLNNRINEIKSAFNQGYLVLTGSLIGLEGQTEESLLNDILLTKELHAEMATFGPVLPKGPKTDLILKVLALYRLADPKNARIVVTTGFETLDPDARRKGMMAGASSLMLNVTPMKYRRLYNIYPNRAHGEETIEAQIKDTLELLYSLGRAPTDLGVTL
jgi:biotin synthase